MTCSEPLSTRNGFANSIYERVDVAPAVEEVEVNGVRLLVLLISPAPEPIDDTSGRIRWRVGAHCAPVDRAEWWQHRQDVAGYDSMATATARTTEDVTDGAMVDARRYMFVTGSEDARTIGPSDLLRRLGVLRPDGRLTQAGVLLFCPADRTDIAMSMLDVEGGDVLLPASDLAGLSIEQLSVTEDRLDSVNTDITVRGGFAESRIRRVPSAAVREAVLNALVHRDWLQPDPVTVTWSQADSALQVISPGGFVGGITSQTLLMQRFARHPALADLFRALGLVEKQGLGVDRMYREMVALGRRPPMIVEGPARESGFVWSAATRSSRSWRSPRTSGSAA